MNNRPKGKERLPTRSERSRQRGQLFQINKLAQNRRSSVDIMIRFVYLNQLTTKTEQCAHSVSMNEFLLLLCLNVERTRCLISGDRSRILLIVNCLLPGTQPENIRLGVNIWGFAMDVVVFSYTVFWLLLQQSPKYTSMVGTTIQLIAYRSVVRFGADVVRT